jgi:hypothetical protein
LIIVGKRTKQAKSQRANACLGVMGVPPTTCLRHARQPLSRLVAFGKWRGRFLCGRLQFHPQWEQCARLARSSSRPSHRKPRSLERREPTSARVEDSPFMCASAPTPCVRPAWARCKRGDPPWPRLRRAGSPLWENRNMDIKKPLPEANSGRVTDRVEEG